MKCHRLGGLTKDTYFLTVPEARIPNSKIKVSAGFVASKASFFGSQMAAFSLCPPTVIPQYTRALGGVLCVCRNFLLQG